MEKSVNNDMPRSDGARSEERLTSERVHVGGTMRARAHRHACTLPNPEALGPDIEEGAVNRRPLQALFPLPQGCAGPAAGPGAILLQSTNSVRLVIFSEK